MTVEEIMPQLCPVCNYSGRFPTVT